MIVNPIIGGKNTKDANITPYDVTKGKIAYGSKGRVVGVSPFQFSEDVKVRTIPSYVRAIAEGTVNGKSVMVGVVHLPEGLMAGTDNVYVSYDKGVTWKSITNKINVGASGSSQGLGTSKWNDICWDPVGKKFLAVGNKGAVAWSSDGIKWTEDSYTQEVTGGAGDITNISCCPDRRGGALWCNGNGTIFHIYKNYTLVESFGHIPAVQFIGISAQAIKRTNGSTTVNTYALCAAGMSVDSSTNQAHKYVYVYSPKVNQSSSSGDVSVMSVSSDTQVVDEYENIIETQEYVMEPRLISVANYGGLENQVLEDEQLELVSFTVSYEDGLWDANLDSSALVSSELTTKAVKDSCSGKILYGLDDTLVTYKQGGVGGTISFPDFNNLSSGSDVVISNHLAFSGVDDTLYILDLGNKRIFHVDFDTGEVSTSVIWGYKGDLIDTEQVESDFGITVDYKGLEKTLKGSCKSVVLPESSSWSSVMYGNGKFVVIGNHPETILYSDDGITWKKASLPDSSFSFSKGTFGGGKFVAFLSDYRVFYSTDGIVWSIATLPSTESWRAVTYGNGKFVATAYNSQIAYYSTDGITWKKASLHNASDWQSVCYGNGKFLVIAPGSANAECSSDGVTWSQVALPSGVNWISVAYGRGKFVAITRDSGYYAYSSDGEIWTQATLPKEGYHYAINYFNDKFIIFSSNFKDIYYSADGITWTVASISTDNWVNTKIPSTSIWSYCAYSKDRVVAVGTSSTRAVYSTDGIVWSDRDSKLFLEEDRGNVTEISSASEMSTLLIEENVGKVYKYTGATTTKYINGDYYLVEEGV